MPMIFQKIPLFFCKYGKGVSSFMKSSGISCIAAKSVMRPSSGRETVLHGMLPVTNGSITDLLLAFNPRRIRNRDDIFRPFPSPPPA